LGNVFVGSPSARARQPILSANWNFLSFKVKFEPIFFQVFWQFFNLKGSLLRQRRTGVAGGRGVGGNSARHTNFGRNQFEFFRTHTAKSNLAGTFDVPRTAFLSRDREASKLPRSLVFQLKIC